MKNKGKGGKNQRRRKNDMGGGRDLTLKEEDQEYAQVLRMLGNGRLEAYCFDGQRRLCHIRGKMRRKVWVNSGDIILIAKREFEDDKADVIQKYTSDEARRLKAQGELPENAKINENDAAEGDGVEFEAGDGELEVRPQGEIDYPSSGSDSEEEDPDVDDI